MRSIMLDELSHTEVEAIKTYLNQRAEFSGLEGLYWLLFNSESEPEPHRLAIEVGDDWVKFELLKRSFDTLYAENGFSNLEQTVYIVSWAENMVRELGLKTC